MSEHRATVQWEYAGTEFVAGRYSRAHSWRFDGGAEVPASAAPGNVRGPWTDPAGVDPEEAFVAAISSCHMLMFLWLASKAGFAVSGYVDAAVGRMTPNERGHLWLSAVELAPRIEYLAGAAPDAHRERELHHRAHEGCYIANSVRTAITIREQPGAPA